MDIKSRVNWTECASSLFSFPR